MIFEYRCESCSKLIEREYSIGKAPSSIKCDCGNDCDRYYGSMNFVLKGSGWPGRSLKMKQEQTKLNDQAGKRMRKNRSVPVRTVAYDYGNGDVREVD